VLKQQMKIVLWKLFLRVLGLTALSSFIFFYFWNTTAVKSTQSFYQIPKQVILLIKFYQNCFCNVYKFKHIVE